MLAASFCFKMAELTWYVVETGPRQEGLAVEELKRQGFETLYLHYVAVAGRPHRRIRVLRPLFPHYVFASLANGQSVPQINRTIGVSAVVAQGDKPLAVPKPVIEELRQRGDAHGLVQLSPEQTEEHRIRFYRGEGVRVVEGSFAGFLGIVDVDSGPKVELWVQGFGGRVKVQISSEGLKSA